MNGVGLANMGDDIYDDPLLRIPPYGRRWETDFFRTETFLGSWMPALIMTLLLAHHHFVCTLDRYKITNLHATLTYEFLLLLRYIIWL
jgi:hypothetical protein